MKSQTKNLLSHLESGRSITPIEALSLYGIFRLGARILDLRQSGYRIQTHTESKNGKRFARYSLVAEKVTT